MQSHCRILASTLHSRTHAGQYARAPYSVLEVVDVDLRVLVDERYANVAVKLWARGRGPRTALAGPPGQIG